MITAQVATNYFLWRAPEVESDFSNLKIQKFLYYAQGYCLARHENPLFADSIEAWAHGPVVDVIYHKYKKFGKNPIDRLEELTEKIEQADKDILDEVFNDYGKISAWELRNMTHNEPPFKEAGLNSEISLQSIFRFFSKKLNIKRNVNWEELEKNSITVEQFLAECK